MLFRCRIVREGNLLGNSSELVSAGSGSEIIVKAGVGLREIIVKAGVGAGR